LFLNLPFIYDILEEEVVIMKLRIFAEDKPAEKVFDYQLELADETIILSTALLSGAIALAGLFSALKEK